jgi:hypothetical protein
MPELVRNGGGKWQRGHNAVALEATCTAKTVDATVRGAFIGLIWGIAARRHSRTWLSTQSTAQSALSSAADFAGLVGIYTGVQCGLGDGVGTGAIANEAAAGAAAGVFYGARVSSGHPRTVAGCSLALAGAGALKAVFLPA